jgi:hypothetical protein
MFLLKVEIYPNYTASHPRVTSVRTSDTKLSINEFQRNIIPATENVISVIFCQPRISVSSVGIATGYGMDN